MEGSEVIGHVSLKRILESWTLPLALRLQASRQLPALFLHALPTILFCLATDPKETVPNNLELKLLKAVNQNKSFFLISLLSQAFWYSDRRLTSKIYKEHYTF